MASTFRSFKHRNFRLFFSGQMVSLIGTWIQLTAESWLIYRLTQSTFLLGLSGFIGQLPSFVFAPIAGYVVDRMNRQRIVITAQICSMLLAFIMATLTFMNIIHVWQIMLLGMCSSMVSAFEIPARQSMVVELVGIDDLPNAIALNSSMVNGARIAGPAIAGLLVAAFGEAWCFTINGMSYLAVIAGLFAMRLARNPRKRPMGSFIETFREGTEYVRTHFIVRDLLIILGVCGLLGVPYLTLMPIFADQLLHGGPKALGFLLGMSGLGAFIAAIMIASLRDIRLLRPWLFRATVAFGVSLILFSQAPTLLMAAVLVVPVGFFMMLQASGANATIQSMVPDRLRGRVMAFYSMMIVGVAPFGALLAGTLADRIGARWTVTITGSFCALIGLLLHRRQKLYKSLPPDARDESQDETPVTETAATTALPHH